MISKLVQWILSKLFPYNDVTMAKEPIILVHEWDKQKLRENEEFCGKQNGRILRTTKMYREVQKW